MMCSSSRIENNYNDYTIIIMHYSIRNFNVSFVISHLLSLVH
jgi:hypothetical protein